MQLVDIQQKVPHQLFEILTSRVKELRPCQEKAIAAGLLEGKNLVVCTPTASGKTLVAELASLKNILEKGTKAIYVVPLRALGTEKFKDFQQRYGSLIKVAVSTGDFDAADSFVVDKDLIGVTAEKMGSLIRHRASWISRIGTIIIDEAHLLNDKSRGPTVEILITMLRMMLKEYQLLALSATIGNPQEFAAWLDAELVEDDWRPVILKKGILYDHALTFYED